MRKKQLAEDDYLGEFMEMIAPPRWGWLAWLTGPSVVVGGIESTFGPRLDRN